MRAIILAQGESSRWDDPTGIYAELKRTVPYKHWLPVGDKTMIGRTVELLNRYIYDPDIYVVAEPSYADKCPGAEIYTQETVGDLVDAIYQTRHLWHDRGTIYLHGDVLFSRLAIDLLVNPHSTKVLLARIEPNKLTGKQADEIFGFYIGPKSYSEVWKRVLRYHQGSNASTPKPWVFLHLLWDIQSFGVKEGLKQVKDLITSINDYTDDIDSPQGFDQFWGPMKASAEMEDYKCSTL